LELRKELLLLLLRELLLKLDSLRLAAILASLLRVLSSERFAQILKFYNFRIRTLLVRTILQTESLSLSHTSCRCPLASCWLVALRINSLNRFSSLSLARSPFQTSETACLVDSFMSNSQLELVSRPLVRLGTVPAIISCRFHSLSSAYFARQFCADFRPLEAVDLGQFGWPKRGIRVGCCRPSCKVEMSRPNAVHSSQLETEPDP